MVEEPLGGGDGDLADFRVGAGEWVVGGGDDLAGVAVGGRVGSDIDEAVSGGPVDDSEIGEGRVDDEERGYADAGVGAPQVAQRQQQGDVDDDLRAA
ncbi:hypothetical protein [Streptomyces sp. YIM 132580]|uniref:hypothetical protein n=1 Tax=Streptomyces sp. YIM 132580 TaxID=2691958 RepID=UPI00136BB3F9|nr:hypothetical protein [Streptomyces sp. YIM 132580]MXG30322.1 hypothetical protein [Streptomyces sp. YIM 132580]